MRRTHLLQEIVSLADQNVLLLAGETDFSHTFVHLRTATPAQARELPLEGVTLVDATGTELPLALASIGGSAMEDHMTLVFEGIPAGDAFSVVLGDGAAPVRIALGPGIEFP